MIRHRHIWLIVALWVLAACSSTDSEPLPTLAELPGVTGALPTQDAPPTATGVAQRVTLPAAWTQTPSATPTHTATVTPSMTITETPTFTPSATITETPSITPTYPPTLPPAQDNLLALALTARVTTPLPDNFIVPDYEGFEALMGTPTPLQPISTGVIIIPTQPISGGSSCSFLPPGNFGTIYTSNPDIANLLGCPSGNPPDINAVAAAEQRFEKGAMIWLNGTIYVLYDGRSFQRYDDTFAEGTDPERPAGVAPAGLQIPVRGFGKVWATFSNVQAGLGYATGDEVGAQASVLNFANGRMISLQNQADTLVIIGQADANTGSWRMVSGAF